MSEMKKRLLTFIAAALFAALALETPIFAGDVPKEILEKTSAVFETAESDDGQWLFVNATSADDQKNRLYSFNQKTKETQILFEPAADTRLRFIYGMAFYPKTQKLYFMVHCGTFAAHGKRNLFLHEGLHTAQKDTEGNYSAAGVQRQSALAVWLMRNLWNAYIEAPDGPDYDGFLRALYTFADTGTNPIFAVEARDGEALYEKEAMEWIVQSGQAKEFLGPADGMAIFPLEKYLLCRDDAGNVLQKSAVTIQQRNPLNYEYAAAIWSETTFAAANDSLYFILMQGSMKNVGLPSEDWSWDYSQLFELRDDENGIQILRPEAAKEVAAAIYPFGKNDPLPIEGSARGLVIRDVDGRTKWLYDGNEVTALSGAEFFKARIIGDDSASTWLLRVCAGLVFAILLLLLLFYEFLKGRFSVAWQRKIEWRIQEEERRKISRDIHDSIVQDIRAIRISAEMLKVQAGEEQKQSDLIEKITDCIVRMRNICYGLEPAEFSLPSPAGQKINLLSILNSLAAQFESKSKIKCSLNAESAAGGNAAGNADEILVEKEKCQCLVRIVQEALANIEKHSYATEAQILARTESQQDKKILTLFIIDNGRGCDLEKVKASASWRTHFGMRQMKERAKTIGAEISFRSAIDDGMQIKISVEI